MFIAAASRAAGLVDGAGRGTERLPIGSLEHQARGFGGGDTKRRPGLAQSVDEQETRRTMGVRAKNGAGPPIEIQELESR